MRLPKNKIILLALLIAAALQATAQPVPVDPQVKIGKLDNGLTYYIRHNEYPKGQAEFFIAQKVGSILEEDNQRGLAHFLEHMCFNGTKSFPGNGVIKWCEQAGIKFGYNLNAYTSIERTVYNISAVPTARAGVQDTCLLILHDWADGLLLDPAEIDAERSVIHEEWRSQTSASTRILEKILPTIYPGNRYGYRLPIGTMDVVDHFPYQALRDYYERWYRPDLQGILVVGDIDVDYIEAKIKEIFSPIKMPGNAPERTVTPVADNKEPIYAIGTDKEQANQIVSLMFKHPATPDSVKGDIQYLLRQYAIQMACNMLNARFSELAAKPDAPLAQAEAGDGDFFISRTKGALDVTGVAKDDILATLETVYREVLRAKQFGFTPTEYVRARQDYLSSIETQYKNRNQQRSSALVGSYVEHFLDCEPAPGIETLYQLANLIVPNVPVEAVNQLFQTTFSTDSNLVVMALLPEKPEVAVPTQAQLAQVIERVHAETLQAYVDNVKQEPLIASLPAKGKITKRTPCPEFQAEEWTLSNGVKVLVKKTDYKDDEVLMRAIAPGGTSTLPDSDAANIAAAELALGKYSLGAFTNNDLEKYTAGKQVSLALSPNEYTTSIAGSTTPKDLPTLMEMLHMAFTGLSFDSDEYKALIATYSTMIRQQESTPQYVFQDKVYSTLYRSPKKQLTTADQLLSANRERAIEIARGLFSNAGRFSFIFVGNYDEAALADLVEQYIATLPATSASAKPSLAGLGITRGNYQKEYATAMEVPQVYAAIHCVADAPFTPRNAAMATITGQILSTRLLESVREKEGATYSIGASCAMSRLGDDPVTLRIAFPMKPEKKDIALGIVKQEIKNLASDITPEELDKVRQYLLKQHQDDLKKNSTWLRQMASFQILPVNLLSGYDDMLNALTTDDLKQFAAMLNAQDNISTVILNPEDKHDDKPAAK